MNGNKIKEPVSPAQRVLRGVIAKLEETVGPRTASAAPAQPVPKLSGLASERISQIRARVESALHD